MELYLYSLRFLVLWRLFLSPPPLALIPVLRTDVFLTALISHNQSFFPYRTCDKTSQHTCGGYLEKYKEK
jgi:hypothetical protein